MKRIGAVLRGLEVGLLAAGVIGLVALAFGQLVTRFVFHTSPEWLDPLLRHLVLWIGLLGAMAATRDRRHITIDAFSRVLPPRAQVAVRALTGLFAAAVCLLLALATLRFVRDEKTFGGAAIGDLPSWLAAAPIPAAFAVMAWRFARLAGGDAWQAWRGPAGLGASAEETP